MANKKISELDSRASLSLSDLMAVGDPATGYLYKTTISDLKTLTGAGVISFNGRVGVIVPTEGDYNLTQLGDVIITSVTSGQFLRYNGSNFVNIGLSASDIPDLSATYQPLDGDLTTIAALTGTGILKRTGSNTWSLLTDNTANWDTAYSDRYKWDGGSTGLVAATGRTSLGLVIGTDVQAWDADLDAIAALAGTSGFLKKTAANTWSLDTNTYLTTAAGAATYEPIITAGTTAQYWRGDKSWQTLNTAAVAELTNLYFTDARARAAISASTGISYNSTTGAISSTITQYTDALARAAVSLTTTGSSGAATYNSTTGVLNVPTYTLSGLGGQPLDADLTAIAGLLGTSGFLKKTAADTWALDTNTYLTGNQTITLSGDVSGSGATAITTTIGAGKVTNAMLAGSIAASKLVGTDIATVGTITSGIWNGSAIGDSYISSAATWNAKEPAIAAGTTAQYWRGDKTWQTLPSYSLPIASATVLGGIKVGSNLSINATTGVLDATFTYTLPTASTTVLGGVKVDGTTITINGSGVISGANTYSLPVATASVLGGVKIGSGVSVDAAGVISVSTNYQAPINGTGFVKATGTTISYDNSTYLTSGFINNGTLYARTAFTTYKDHSTSAPNDAPIKSLSGTEDNWIYLDAANSQWGIYHRNIDTDLIVTGEKTLPGNSIAYIGGNSLQAYINLVNGDFWAKSFTTTGNITAANFTGSSSGTNSGDQNLQSVTNLGSTTTNTIIINKNSGGAIRINRDLVTNYNGIYYSTNNVLKWFIGLRENLSSDNYILYSEVSSIDVLTANVTSGNVSIYGNITAANLSGTNTGDQTLSGLGGVPTSRTLTINGTAYDLSANRSWNVGTVLGNSNVLSDANAANVTINGGYFTGFNPSNIPSGQSSGDWGLMTFPMWTGNSTGERYAVQLSANLDSNSNIFIRKFKYFNTINQDTWYTLLHDSNGVTLSTDQTITGKKTFSNAFGDNDPVLKLTGTSTATFQYISIAYNASQTAATNVCHFFGKASSVKNSAYIGYQWNANSSDSNFLTLGHYGNDHLIKLYASGSVTFQYDITAGRLRNNGNLVLNSYQTVNPSSNVYLYSTPNDRDMWIMLDSADTGSNWGMYYRQIDTDLTIAGQTTLPANSVAWVGSGSNTLQAYICLANGTAFVRNTFTCGADVIAYSDISVKENIRSIDNVLERINNSRGVLYDRIDTGTKNNIGFIAQELELQFPELVKTNTNGTKSVAYQNAVAILFEAVKAQQKQIDQLKNRN